jgi:hypothetical protein
MNHNYSVTPENKHFEGDKGTIPTPGQIVSELQAQVLNKKLFVTNFGDEIVKGWGFDWAQLEDRTVSIDNPSRVAAMRRLNDKFLNSK